MPVKQITTNLKIEKPEAADNDWEASYWRLASIIDLWLTQLAKGHTVTSGGNLTLNVTAVDLDATEVAFAGGGTFSLGAQTAIALLATGNTYVVYVDNAGALQVSTLDASGLWSGSLPSAFVLMGLVYEVEGAWTIHSLPLNLGRGKANGLARTEGDVIVGSAAQVAAGQANFEINDLDDTVVPPGSKVLLLDGTHTLTASLALTNADIEIHGESTEAILVIPDRIALDQVWGVDDTPSNNEFIDETADANSATVGDFAPFNFTASEAIGDYVAFGMAQPFTKLEIEDRGGTTGTGGQGVWEYWNGSTWSTLENQNIPGFFGDATGGFIRIVDSTKPVCWKEPADWVARVINGSASLYYVRFRLTTAYATNPILDQAWVAGRLSLTGSRVSGNLRISGMEGEATLKVTDPESNLVVSSGKIASGFGRPTKFPVGFPDAVNWSSPRQLGIDFNVAGQTAPAVAPMQTGNADSSTGRSGLVATLQGPNLQMVKFDGNVFGNFGNPFATGAGQGSLVAMSDIDVALIDDTNADLRMYRFDGTNWALLGTELIGVGGADVAIAALNGTDVAIIDGGTRDLIFYRFTFGANTWAQVGNAMSIFAGPSEPSITALNATDVFVTGQNNQYYVCRFDGTDWNIISSALFNGADLLRIMVALNATDVAAYSTFRGIHVLRLNGHTWDQIGDQLEIGTKSRPDMGAMNGNSVAWFDGTDDDLRVYRFDYAMGKPHSHVGGTF